MKDFAAIADEMIDLAISPVFEAQTGEPLPQQSGRAFAGTIRNVISRAGVRGEHHVEDAFSVFIINVCAYLGRYPATRIEQPVHFLHRSAGNTARRYLDQLRVTGSKVTDPLDEAQVERVAGKDGLGELNRSYLRGEILAALETLPARYSELLQLDLIEELSPLEIQMQMGIGSENYFRKLKCEAFKALRNALKGFTFFLLS